MKSVAQFILLWFAALLITAIFIVPDTSKYQAALEKYEQAVAEKKIDAPPQPQDRFFRIGFAAGYIVIKYPLFIATLLIAQTVIVVLIVIFLKRVPKTKPKNILLPDPMDSVKNVLSNLVLFTFGVFNRRASDQLRFYFDLPVRSRIIGLLAYATIFFAITISYNLPKGSMIFRFTLISFLPVLIVVFLLLLVFFYKPFRNNYERKLFWLSLGGLVLVLALSSFTGYQMGQSQLDPNQSGLNFSAFFEPKTIFVNLLIVLAFSFYIEIMKQVSSQKARIDAEMAVAQRIQSDLLPILEIENDSLALYGQTESATEVGGDYCDAINLPNDRFAVAVGDVSGHNVAAGVMMSMLKVAFRTELSYFTDPENLVSSLNKTIYDHKNKAMFISFLFALIDPSNNSVTMINCGHPPLLHFSSEGEIVKKYRTGDVALGLKRDAVFQSQKIQFTSGDVFIFLSDGLIETVNAIGEEFSIDIISELLKNYIDRTPKALYDLLNNSANDFRDQLPQRDDVTIVVVKMN